MILLGLCGDSTDRALEGNQPQPLFPRHYSPHLRHHSHFAFLLQNFSSPRKQIQLFARFKIPKPVWVNHVMVGSSHTYMPETAGNWAANGGHFISYSLHDGTELRRGVPDQHYYLSQKPKGCVHQPSMALLHLIKYLI